MTGGFAHVYLVRTPQPVYGTTHHVLKRIAVANEAMLAEVKKEVDIMVRRNIILVVMHLYADNRDLQRILRGHPNIVYLIDASWNKLPNGTTEAFVLMEFCQGPSSP
jgi:AP2-associated kinase